MAMVRRVNNCVACHREIGCSPCDCAYANQIELICDECGEYADELRYFNGFELCPSCLLDHFDVVEVDE